MCTRAYVRDTQRLPHALHMTRPNIFFKRAFQSNLRLREKYLTPFNKIRMGKLLEDIDLTAGAAGYRHMGETHEKVALVTASFDRLSVRNPVEADKDVFFRGAVVGTGRSSMDVVVQLDQEQKDGRFEPIMVCRAIMVARTQEDKPFMVPALDSAKAAPRKPRQHTPTDTPDFSAQFASLASMLNKSRTRTYPMKKTRTKTIEFMHLQEKNIHGKVFGGFLMRKCYELGYSTAFLFMGEQPLFLASDAMSFLAPVPLGSIVTLEACVVHAGDTTCQVRIALYVLNPLVPNSKQHSNTFYFTFVRGGTKEAEGEKKKVLNNKVFPETMEEMVLYADAVARYESHKEGSVAGEVGDLGEIDWDVPLDDVGLYDHVNRGNVWKGDRFI